MRLPWLLFAATLFNTTFAAETHEVYYQGLLTPQNITPTFDKGYLLVYDFDKIDVYAPDGVPLYSVSAQVRDAKVVNIDNAAADTDGTTVGAVEYSRDGTSGTIGGGIALFDRSGKQTGFFDTGQYLPTQVCFAPNHTVWTIGWRGGRASRETDDYFVLRNFSQDGQEIGAFLPRSSFDPEPDPVGPMVGVWQLRAINDRVGAVFYRSSIVPEGQTPRQMQWIEVDLKGKVLGRWDLGADRHPRAFTQSGALYSQGGGAVLVFDRSTKAWRRIAGTPPGFLLGADGDNLVFEIKGSRTLRWVPASW